MVDPKVIQQELRDLKFGNSPFNQAELRELPKIMHEGEKISELVNGYYEGGFALLVATEMRVLLIDKKPFNFLTVEDLRFDMINEIDYNHRLFGATITISTGGKALKFKSYNQPRLRHLISLVQQHMTQNKREQSEKADNQQQHLEEINKQLQMYLLAQHQQLQQQIANNSRGSVTELPKPDAQLSDYLFAQRLLEQFQREGKVAPADPADTPAPQQQTPAAQQVAAPIAPAPQPPVAPVNQAEMVADARQEVFGKLIQQQNPQPTLAVQNGLEINPMRIAYSKLPMMLRNRKFGRPSFHAHSQQPAAAAAGQSVS